MDIEAVVLQVVERMRQLDADEMGSLPIPVGVSNRHVHLSREIADIIFGREYTFKKMKALRQSGQYAYAETITLVGPKGVLEQVRILGPERAQTQVEVMRSDCRRLGIKPVIRPSGKLEDTPGITLCGPKGSVYIESGVIVAKRHIHMSPADAELLNCNNGDLVTVGVEGERGGTLNEVTVRISENGKLEMHLDIDEANCMSINNNQHVQII